VKLAERLVLVTALELDEDEILLANFRNPPRLMTDILS
jgi:hypothetical protein